MQKTFHFFTLLFTVIVLHLHAQKAHPLIKRDFEFRKDGQAANLLQFKFQDSRGFIWGADGNYSPMRFDGERLERFVHQPEDTTTVSDGSIWGHRSEFYEDSRGCIWIAYSTVENLDCYDPKTERFQRFGLRLKRCAGGKNLGVFRAVVEDSRQNIWIGCAIGVFRYAPRNDSLQFFRIPGNVTVVFEDWEGNIWLNVFKDNKRHSLARIDYLTGSIVEWVDYPVSLQEAPNNTHYHYKWSGGSTVFLVVNENLFLFDPGGRIVSLLHHQLFDETEEVNAFWGENDQLLIATFPGRLHQYFPATGQRAIPIPLAGQGEQVYLFNLFRSRDGMTWLLTMEKNSALLKNHQFFKTLIDVKKAVYPKDIDPINERLNHLFMLNGQVYFSTPKGAEPVRFENHGSPRQRMLAEGIPFKEVQFEFANAKNGHLWLVAGGGEYAYVREFDEQGKLLFSHKSKANGTEGAYPGGYPDALQIDDDGKLWIGTQEKGLILFAPSLKAFRRYGHIVHPKKPNTNAVLIDRANDVWCSAGNILCKLNRKTEEWTCFDGGMIKPSSFIVALHEDSTGVMWVGTLSGLFSFKENEGFKFYGEEKGVEQSLVSNIFEDRHQQLWLTNNESLRLYDRNRDVFIPFDIQDGVDLAEIDHMNDWKADSEGYIFLQSSADGVYYFKPEKMNLKPESPAVHFTDLFLFNHKLKPGDSTGILKQGLDFTDHIVFTFEQNDFSIHYTAPEYTHPDKLEFLVKLDGFHHDWQNMGNKREARFTNLSPGDYTLQVKVRNHFHFESETPRTLQITVLPPWYRTWWAYLLWAAIILGSIFWLYRFQLNRRLAEAEALRLKELDLAKSRLYTNITHEFRTPLTIILGMTDQVKADPKNWFNEGLQLIRRNGKQLLNLVNQMLDLSKLESGHIPLKLVNGDLVSFLHYLTESFHSYSDSKDIRLHFRSDYPELQMDYDPEKLQNVVSNLLSNAIKFTPSGGDVYFDLRLANNDLRLEEAIVNQNAEIVIQVSDNGPGIAAEHLPFIFDRFYQADNTDTRRGEGTGIGLALVKELVKVMGGRIEVESPYAGPGGKGTRFSIWLPVTRTAAPPAPLKGEPRIENPAGISETIIPQLPGDDSSARGGSGGESGSADRFTVLLVEDNPDVVTYLTSVLSLHYRIATARNGQEGIDKAFELVPDLIVSDVMMPEKDGFELCQALKTDERTSHIPIVLLTAKADQKSKIEGLTHGADAYLAKPFHQEELLVRVEKLIELRRRMQERFRTAGSLQQVLDTPPQNLEDLFLQKIIRIIEAEMGDENFGMPQLCKALNMSRTNLFRKLKALTGKSTTLFIRSLRLAKAKTLLETTEMNVTEVCFAVGFNSPNYFSRVFQEEFGVAPSGVRKG